jgi:acyl-CoA hydrolase
MELIEAGVITNERKTLHRGKIISGFLVGSTRLYEFVDNNAMVELADSGRVTSCRRCAASRTRT